MRESAPETRDSLTPFDWALNFTLGRFPALLQIALVPALIKVFLRYVEYFRPVTPRQAFLIVALDLGAKTWLLVTVMLLCIATMQGVRVSVWHLAQKALITMPKVLMSCVALIIIVAAFFLARWMYLFVLFLVWAPLFCAAEITAKSYRAEEREEEEEADETDEDAVRRLPKFRFFADKPVWDFGLSRSIQFTANVRNFIVTVQLALLMLIALTLPIATVVAIAGFHHDFSWVVLESVLSFIIHTAVVCIACATFLRLLPKEAVEEIGIQPELVPPLRKRRKVRLHGRLFPFALIALLGVMATKTTVDYYVVNNSRPPTLVTKVEKTELTEYQFIVTMSMEDNENLFRWLNPLSLRLKLVADGEPAPKVDPEKPVAVLEEDLLEPQRVIPYRLDGTRLPEDTFVPHSGPLRLTIHYENSLREKVSKEQAAKAKYILYYVPLYGEPEPFIEGRIGE